MPLVPDAPEAVRGLLAGAELGTHGGANLDEADLEAVEPLVEA